jgi:hypothetical protein
MLPNLCNMRTIVVANSGDVKWGPVRLSPTLYGARTESLDIQLIPEREPPYRSGIAEEYFEFVELNSPAAVEFFFFRGM